MRCFRKPEKTILYFRLCCLVALALILSPSFATAQIAGCLGGCANNNTVVGSYAGNSATGSGNIYLGYAAGYNDTGSNDFFVNNVQQSTLANDKAYSLMYGSFSGTAGSLAGQQLVINGNVGIGTTSPQTMLQVNGSIMMGTGTCSASTPGSIQYSGGAVQYCNGTSWTAVGGGGLSGGTTNYDARWTSSTALGIGAVYDNGTSVGIGTTSPQSMVHAYNGEVQVGSSGASCTSSNAGAMRYSGGNMLYCNGSAWTFFNPCGSPQLPYNYGSQPAGAGSGNLPSGVWGDGTYIYVGAAYASPYVLTAYTFNTSTHVWTLKSNTTTDTAGGVANIWGDGTYLYMAEGGVTSNGGGTAGIEAWTFTSGTTFTKKASYSTTMNPMWITGIGAPATNIFVADSTNGVKAFTFSGSAFTLKATYAPANIQAETVYDDGTYVYVADIGNGLIRALTFSGTTWTAKATVAITGGIYPGNITGDGTYIYILDYGVGLKAYTFNGTTFTLHGSIDTQSYGNQGSAAGGLFAKNGDIYVTGATGVIEVFSFNGTTFTPLYSYDYMIFTCTPRSPFVKSAH
jgi:hypothetical protein